MKPAFEVKILIALIDPALEFRSSFRVWFRRNRRYWPKSLRPRRAPSNYCSLKSA
jgi:hypothetical protein